MDETELEDGEIVDDTIYTPLERPANYSQVQPNNRFPINLDTESEEESDSSVSENDSDEPSTKVKKPKLKIKPIQRFPTKKKYDVWSTRAKDDLLSETLITCDVSLKDKSRSVEYYDYQLARKLNQSENLRDNKKRTIHDRENPRFNSKRTSEDFKPTEIIPRKIRDLDVTIENSPEEIAKDIANKLLEEKEDLVLNIVNTLGKEQSIHLFKETQNIEAEGGMMIMNYTRRRTPGGVFLYIVRNNETITPEQKKQIFNEERISFNHKQKEKKKLNNAKLKAKIGASRNKILPELLTRTELFAKEQHRSRKSKDDAEHVINPPPTPEPEESPEEGSAQSKSLQSTNIDCGRKSPLVYDEFLDIGCSNDMDLF